MAHDRGIAVVTLDHLPHHRGDAARGSTAKAQIVDVPYSIEPKPPVTRTRPGKLKLTCRKDRPSYIGKGSEIWLAIGDGQGKLPITPSTAPEQAGEWGERQRKMIDALDRWEQDNPGDPGLSQNAVLKLAALSKGTKVIEELDKLAEDPDAPVHRSQKPKGKGVEFRYRYVPVEDHGGLDC